MNIAKHLLYILCAFPLVIIPAAPPTLSIGTHTFAGQLDMAVPSPSETDAETTAAITQPKTATTQTVQPVVDLGEQILEIEKELLECEKAVHDNAVAAATPENQYNSTFDQLSVLMPIDLCKMMGQYYVPLQLSELLDAAVPLNLAIRINDATTKASTLHLTNQSTLSGLPVVPIQYCKDYDALLVDIWKAHNFSDENCHGLWCKTCISVVHRIVPWNNPGDFHGQTCSWYAPTALAPYEDMPQHAYEQRLHIIRHVNKQANRTNASHAYRELCLQELDTNLLFFAGMHAPSIRYRREKEQAATQPQTATTSSQQKEKL